MWNYISVILVLALTMLCWWNLLKKRFAMVKNVRAQLVEKNIYDVFSKTNPNLKAYTLVFQTETGKRLSFQVSEFSYGGYKLKKKGTLKYKGDMILEFK